MFLPHIAALLVGCSLKLGPLYVPAAHHPPDALAEIFGSAEPEEVFYEAIERRQAGDTEGALHRLVWLRNQGDTSPVLLYQIGVTYEAEEDFEMALRAYDLLLSESQDPSIVRDAGFRRAQVLEELERYLDALRQLRRIRPPKEGFDEKDRLTFDIETACVRLMLRRRFARPHLETLLESGRGNEEVAYIRAKGWSDIIRVELENSSAQRIEGSSTKLMAITEKRAATILEAETLLDEELVPLRQPRWTLIAFLALGDAYTALARDIQAAAPPKKLTPEQDQIYTEMVDEQALVLTRRAWARYDSALTYAGTLGLESQVTRILEERLETTASPP